jgi:hypothetical protein
MCYRKKTRCEVEGSASICEQCVRRRTNCVFPAVSELSEEDQRYVFWNFGFQFLISLRMGHFLSKW